MRLLVDENIPADLVTSLRGLGYNVLWVAEVAPGVSDRRVMEMAAAEGRHILTADKDFGELVYHSGSLVQVPGVILLRPHWQDLRADVGVEGLVAVLANHKRGHFTVIERDRVRVRPMHS